MTCGGRCRLDRFSTHGFATHRCTILTANANLGSTWLHSYVTPDRKRTFCIYEGPTPEALRRAAVRNKLPISQISEVRVLDPYLPMNGQILKAQEISQKTLSRLLLIALPLLVPLAALAAEPVAYVNAARPLLDKVRSATARYRGLNATLADGFVRPLVVAGQVALVGQLLLKARTRFAWQAVRVA